MTAFKEKVTSLRDLDLDQLNQTQDFRAPDPQIKLMFQKTLSSIDCAKKGPFESEVSRGKLWCLLDEFQDYQSKQKEIAKRERNHSKEEVYLK